MNIENLKLWCSEVGHLNKDQAEFMIKMAEKQQPKYCLETGFCSGRSSSAVIAGTEKSIKKFITVDKTFKKCGRYRAGGWLEKFEGAYPFYKGIQGNTMDLLNKDFFEKEFPNRIDWFTVDGDHSYRGCKHDLESALPYMNKNSIIIVDDYESNFPNGRPIPTVTEACDDFYNTHSDKLVKSKWNKKGKGFCIFRVTSESSAKVS